MQIISNIALLSINETLIVQLLSFLIFLFIINRVMFRPLRSTMDEREDYLKKINNEIVDAKDELETIARRIEAHESAVKLEAFGLKDKLEESGNQEAAEIIASAREEITGLKQNAASQIDLQISDARDHLKRESEALSMNIMEKILDRRPTQ
ncbi:MAG: hypothetical protein QNI95_21190 [Desulfobacterales bacterium]|nr:hypothetical protein [Desulfobacterales bacterium]